MKTKENPEARVMVQADDQKLEVYSPDGKLRTVIDQAGLEGTKAQVLLDKFSASFKLAAEWEIKARSIVVTDISQTAEMKMARAGRLFIREHRLEIEGTRKALKEESLREGRAIDGIANVLKGVFGPIEEYLDRQEHFAQRLEEEAAEAARLEMRARLAAQAEEDRVAREKAEAARQEKIRKENAKLRKEALERDKILEQERLEREAERKEELAARAEERRKMQAAHEKAAREAEKKAAVERKKLQEAHAKSAARALLVRQKAEAKERKEADASARLLEKERAAKVAAELKVDQMREKFEEKHAPDAPVSLTPAELAALTDAGEVVCPHCGKSFRISK